MDTAVTPLGIDSSGHLLVSEVSAWAAAADTCDDVTGALRLLELAEQLQHSELVGPALDRARLLLLSGRPAAGLAVLAQAGVEQVADDGVRPEDCVLAACLAANGQQTAFDWLLWAAAHVPAETRWWMTYLVAAAADGRGEREISGRAWCNLVFEFGVTTGFTVPRAAAALVERRDHAEVATAVAAVGRAVDLLSSRPTPLGEDASPALLAVELLRDHGDSAGARLLLTALVARLGRVTPLVLALETATPVDAQRRYVARTRLVAGTAFLALIGSALLLGPTPLQVLGGTAFVLGRGWQRLGGVPGFTRVDGGVWRAFRAVHYDVRTGMATTSRKRRISQLDIAGAVVGLLLAFSVGNAVSTAAERLLGTATPTRHELADCAATVAFVAVVAAAMCASGFWQRASAHKRREARREAQRRASTARLSTCRCWDTSRLEGADALLYRSRHLVAVDEAAAVAAVQQLAGEAQLFGCRRSGALWVSAPLALGQRDLLLRGSVPDRPAVAAAGTRPSDTIGFYL